MKLKKWILLPVIFLLLISLSACGGQAPTEQVSRAPTITTLEATADQLEISPSQEGYDLGLTYQQADGNRLVSGQGQILDADPIMIELGGEIQWLVGLRYGSGSLWTAVLADGTIESYTVQDGEVKSYDIGRGALPPGMPPLILAQEGELYLNPPPAFGNLRSDSSGQPSILNPAGCCLSPTRETLFYGNRELKSADWMLMPCRMPG